MDKPAILAPALGAAVLSLEWVHDDRTVDRLGAHLRLYMDAHMALDRVRYVDTSLMRNDASKMVHLSSGPNV